MTFTFEIGPKVYELLLWVALIYGAARVLSSGSSSKHFSFELHYSVRDLVEKWLKRQSNGHQG